MNPLTLYTLTLPSTPSVCTTPSWAAHSGLLFDDTWRWHEAVDDFHNVASQPRLAGMIEGLRMMLGEGPQLAYLSYMANRLVECHRALKPTGSIYLHCDPTMSHYLKTVMDGVFGNGSFVNEISWHRSQTRSSISRKFRALTISSYLCRVLYDSFRCNIVTYLTLLSLSITKLTSTAITSLCHYLSADAGTERLVLHGVGLTKIHGARTGCIG